MLSNVLRVVGTVCSRNGLGELAAVACGVTIYCYKLAGTIIALDGVLRTITLIEFIVLEECVETIRVIEVDVWLCPDEGNRVIVVVVILSPGIA